LLVSIANIANLLFARAAERRRDAAVRLALGASPRDLIGQVLCETITLSIAGAGLGLAVATLVLGVVKTISPQQLYRLQETNIDVPALLFVVALIVIVSALCGCLPAWASSRIDPDDVLKVEGARTRSSGPQRHSMQSLLIIGQCHVRQPASGRH
jgi:ABC-type antimicrobial peptide transport system permease subunit